MSQPQVPKCLLVINISHVLYSVKYGIKNIQNFVSSKTDCSEYHALLQ